ncbi:MAG: hypothetical protein WC565_03700 [Parcubacteria group bacterium]
MVKKNIQKTLIVTGGAIVAGILIYLGISFFGGGKANRALSQGKIEIASEDKLGDYFVFVSPEDAKTLLQRNEGKFLFPQIDLSIADGKSLVIEEKQGMVEGKEAKFVTISGLPAGIKIYSVADGYVRGGVASNNGTPYAWIRQTWAKAGNSDVMLTYIPAIRVGTLQNPVWNMEGIEEDMYIPVEMDVTLANLLTDGTLPNGLISGDKSIAVSMAGEDGSFTKLSLSDILTYKGKIVMVQK